MTDPTPIVDASTAATRTDAWTVAEHTARLGAARLDGEARDIRERAGELAGRPDMADAASRLDTEATAAEHDADTRRGLAQGYAAIRGLTSGATAAPGTALELAAAPAAPSISDAPASTTDTDDEEYDEDDDAPAAPEVYTHCAECDEPLDEPTTDEEKSVHDDCDITKPDRYWWGDLTADGKKVDRDTCEGYRNPRSLAVELIDRVLEFEGAYGESFIELEDGTVVDARTWIEQPEHLELGGGLEQYDGQAEFDPAHPNRCWVGSTLPSGRIARPMSHSFDTVAELADDVCGDIDKGYIDNADRQKTVMLPGGELVDALEWGQRPEVRDAAGYGPVQFDPTTPEQCWFGAAPGNEPRGTAPVARHATAYDDVTELAAEVCRRVYETQGRDRSTGWPSSRDRIHENSAPHTVMLPGGELVDAYEWAHRADALRLAGYEPARPDADASENYWLGPAMMDGEPVRQFADSFATEADLARAVCHEVFEKDAIDSHRTQVIVLPDGARIDAYDWSQQPETRRLAGCTTVRNRITHQATATCRDCRAALSCESERIVQGEIGGQGTISSGMITCDCGSYGMTDPITIAMVDDDSGAEGRPARQL